MHKTWLYAKWNLRALAKSPRMIMCAVMGFLMCYLLTEFTISLSQTYQTTLQGFEPFIWCFADADSIFFAALVLMLLLAGLPQLNAAESYFVFRTDRKTWIFGQVLTIFIVTFGYCLFLFVSTTFLCAGQANYANTWSDTAVLLSFSTDSFQTAVTVARNIVKVTHPYAALINIFVLLFQYVLLAGLVQLTITIWKNKKTGVLVAICFHAFGYLLTPDRFVAWMALDDSQKYIANLLTAWLSPLRQATYMMHNFGYDQLPRLWVSHLILGGVSLILGILSYTRMRKFNFQFGGDGLYVE